MRTTAARDREIVRLRTTGLTLQAIADRFGMTRERVRQIVAREGGPGGDTVRALREEKAARRLARVRAQVLAELDRVPGRSAVQVGRALALDPALVKAALGEEARERLAPEPKACARVAEHVLLGELRLVAEQVEGPLSAGEYDRRRRALGLHSTALHVARFGSWREACRRAGVEAPAARREYGVRWTREEIVDWVERAVSQPGSRGTVAEYDAFARRTSGAPSGSQVRLVLGSWSAARAEVLRRRPRPEGIVPEVLRGLVA